MIIMSIDPSTTNVGVVIFNTSDGMLVLSQTFVFKQKDKDIFLKEYFKKKIIKVSALTKDVNIDERKKINSFWLAHRLNKITEFLKNEIQEKEVERVIIESQWHIDLLRFLGSTEQMLAGNDIWFEEFYPNSWRKIINLSKKMDKKVLLQALRNFATEILGEHYTKHMTEHEIDAFCMLIAYLKKNKMKIKIIKKD